MQRSSYRQTYVGRSIGGLALLPSDDVNSPPFMAIGCHETPGDSSVYSLPTLELRMETEEIDEGNTEDASATELVVAAYAEHPGAVTALASGNSVRGRRAPGYVLTGSSQGALGLYPLHLPNGLSGGLTNGDPQASPALGVADPQGGAYGVAAAEWTIDSNRRGSGGAKAMRGGIGGWCKSPIVSVGVTSDGSRCAGLQADGVASVHAPEALGGPAVACWQADPITSAGLCWRADGGAVVTVGAAGLKLWDLAALGSTSGQGARPALSIATKDVGRKGCTFTCVAAPTSGAAHTLAAGTSDGLVVVWDLRMTGGGGGGSGTANNPLSAHAVAMREAHGGLPVRTLAFHPTDPTALLSGGADGTCVLNDLAAQSTGAGGASGFLGVSHSSYSSGGSSGGSSAGTVLARSSSSFGGPAAACMALAFDLESAYLAAGFDSESVAVVQGHPRLSMGSRFN